MSTMMSEPQRGRRLNRARFLLDRKVTPATVLDWACESHPDSALLHTQTKLPYPLFGDRGISPREALRFAAAAGEVMVDAGMKRNDRVAIFKSNEVDYVLLSLAVIRAGGIAVPVNPGMPVEQLGRYLAYTGCEMICCDRIALHRTIGTQESLPTVKRWIVTDGTIEGVNPAAVLSEAIAEVSGERSPVRLHTDSRVILAHTSGTTGTPKAVVGTAGSVIEGIRAHYRTEPALPWKRVALAGPFSHLVFQIGLTTLLLSNMPTWALGDNEPGPALEAIERERINLFVAFPELFLRMYAKGLEAHDLSSMRVWISVADTSQEAHMRAFCRQGDLLRFLGRPLGGSIFVEPLGSSEIGGPALRRVWLARSPIRCRRRIGRRMLWGPKVRIADGENRSVGPGKAGRLMVKGKTLFAGYWNAHDEPQGAVADGWWATGDVARRDRMRRIYHLDREVDVVHTEQGPFYTLPAEDVLHSHPDVLEAVVFGAPHRGGMAPVGLVWLKEGASVVEASLMRWANERIDGPVGLHAVRRVRFADIPRGLTGKVLKRELRERYGDSASRTNLKTEVTR